MRAWHPQVVDFFRRHLASDSFIRPYAKRIVEDARSLLHTGRDWASRQTDPPQALFVETTNICNANCVFCAYQYQDRFRSGRGVMSDGLFAKAMADYAALAPKPEQRHVNFTPVVGEPLADPHIIQRIAQAKAIGADVTFFTNGILFDRIDLGALLDTGVDRIYISTGPFERDSYERIYRTQGKYGELLASVQKLLDARNERKAATRVNFMFRSPIPLSQIVRLPDFKRCILPRLRPKEVRNLYAQVRGFDSWGGQIQPSDLPQGMGIAQAPRLKRRPCVWTFNPMVLYDGLVRACPCRFTGSQRVESDGLMVGDLRKQTLAEIWQGEPLRTLRMSFGRGQLHDVCRSCTMYRSV